MVRQVGPGEPDGDGYTQYGRDGGSSGDGFNQDMSENPSSAFQQLMGEDLTKSR